MSHDPPETLPGMEAPPPAAARSGLPDLRAEVSRSIDALRAAGRVTDADAGKVAAADYLAAIIMAKERTGKASTVANDARLLVEILTDLAPEEGAEDAQLRDAMEAWSQAMDAPS